MIISTIIINLIILVGYNVVVDRDEWQVFNCRMEVHLPDCCRSTEIRFRRENGSFMLDRMRFVIKTMVLMQDEVHRENDGFKKVWSITDPCVRLSGCWLRRWIVGPKPGVYGIQMMNRCWVWIQGRTS